MLDCSDYFSRGEASFWGLPNSERRVTTDPQLLRAEAFTEIGSLIERDAALLVERWCRRAIEEQPNAKRVHHRVLRDGLAKLLRLLGRGLAEADPDDTCHHHLLAGEHGEQRWEHGWLLTEVVRDYQILRLVILEYLEEMVERPLSYREQMAVGLALDEAITASVAMYVSFRDEHTRDAERRQAQQEWQAAEALRQWEQIFKYAGWGIAVIDATDFALSSVNPSLAAMHGCTVDELCRKPYQHLFAVDARQTALECLQRAGVSQHFSFELPHVRRDGTQLPVLSSVTAFKDDGGQVLYYAANFQDISERKRLEESLAQQASALRVADRRKDEFLAMLAHELRNPLTPILNALELMRLPDVDPATLEQAHDVIDRQLQQLVRLVDDLLDLARISRGKVLLRKEPILLQTAVSRAVESSRPFIRDRRHELAVRLPAEPVEMDVDPARLEQILINLLNNAAKYTEPGGHVELRAELEDGSVALHVRDDGTGIAPELIPHVFELFTQSNRLSGRTEGGLGVGLALVRSLVELHGGSVSVSSAGIGRGSQFTVRLPVSNIAAGGERSMLQGHDVPAVKKLRLLLVDDNKDVVNMLAMLLRRVGHEVQIAHDGLAAIEAARQHKPEVVLLDIGLPGMSGYEVAEKLRSEKDLNHFRLIAMTGYGQDEDVSRAKQSGFDDHLLKPVRLESIQQALTRLESPPT